MIELIPTSWSELEPYALTLFLAGFFLGVAPLLPKRRGWARILVVTIGLVISVYYLAWRLTDTILPADLMSPAGAWYLCIYAFELVSFVNYSIMFLTLTRWAERSSEADRHEAELRSRPFEQLPSVDVFIPTYNEGPEVLHRTILAALAIDYPKFQVWVLDDGGRDWLAEYCAAAGAGYIRRRERKHAKAGNLNHGLSVTNGELFAIFDADFAASRNFLYRTAGFFDDPKIGIVQTPQHFFNPDPIQLNLGLSRVMPDDQRLFFGVLAQSRDAWDCAFCCGSCSIQRRQAIESVGGVPTDSITEDILSTMVLLRRGYITRYLNERLSMGLAAESLNGYFTQRTRWCRGALQTLFLRSGPLGPGLTLLQRFFFFPLDWLVQYPVRMVAMIVPIVFIWTGVGPFLITSLDDLLAHQLPTYVALAWAMRFFAPGCYVPILSTAVSFFSSLRLVPTALATMIKPFGAPFRVTPKGNNNAECQRDRVALGTIAVLALLTIVGMIVNRIYPDEMPGGHAALLVAECYALVNLVILALAAAMALEVPRPRRNERFPILRPGAYRLAEQGRDSPCVLLDISETGALLGSLEPIEVGRLIELDIAGLGMLPARVVRRPEPNIAVEFCSIPEDERTRINEFIYSAGLCNEVNRLQISVVVSNLLSFLLGIGAARPPSRTVRPAARRPRRAHVTVLAES
jgi:cellulose synthase (UDP-forming)